MARKPVWPPPVHRHASGQARVRIRGVDHYLGIFGSEEAARNYAELITRLASGQDATAPPAPTPTGTTVAVVVARWFAEEAPRYSADGREVAQYRMTVQPLIRLFGSTPAREFDCEKLEAVQLACATGAWRTPKDRQWCEKHGRPIEWSRKVINRRIVRIRTIWRWAERKKLVPHGSFAHLCTLPGLASTDPRTRHTPRRKPATMEEVNRVCKFLPPVGKALLLLQWWTGMRSGEVRTMRRDELDQSGEVWIYRPGQHKRAHAGQTRVVAIGARGQAVLRQWLANPRCGADYLFTPAKRHKGTTHYARDGYTHLIARAAKRAGLPGWTAYRTRHGAKDRVTRALGLDAARSMLGQRSLDVCNTYGDAVDLQTATRAAQKLG